MIYILLIIILWVILNYFIMKKLVFLKRKKDWEELEEYLTDKELEYIEEYLERKGYLSEK